MLFEGVTAGDYQLIVDAPGYARTTANVSVTSEDVSITLDMQADGHIVATVTIGGVPATGNVFVSATRGSEHPENLFFGFAESGGFDLGGLPAGVYDLLIVSDNAVNEVTGVTVNAGQTFDLGVIDLTPVAANGGALGAQSLAAHGAILEARLIAAETYLQTVFIPAITTRFGPQVGWIWQDFLSSSPSSPRTRFFTNGSAVVEGDFFENGFRGDTQVDAFLDDILAQAADEIQAQF